MPWKRLLVGLLCTTLALAGCTTLRAVPIAGPETAANPHIKAGREAMVILKTGAVMSVKLVSADSTAITVTSKDRPEPYPLAYGDIQSLDVRRVSAGKTTTAVVLPIVVILGAAYLALLKSIEGSD